MALPNFDSFSTVWIEKTKASHEHGGLGWEFGTCLWSPSEDSAGRKIYEGMRKAQTNDLVLHFYEDNWFGEQSAYHFCAFSLVANPCTVRADAPPKAGNWANRSQYYRVNLKDFTPLEESIPIEDFIARYRDALALDAQKPDGPFIRYQESVRLAQGKYLSRCSPELYACLSEDIHEPLFIPDHSRETSSSEGNHSVNQDDHIEFLEGQRQRRESAYFLRNRQLVIKAKEAHGFLCQACGFDFNSAYGELGAKFIECHHLNPLSERYKTKADSRSSKITDVAVLCSNCHRMIHRLMRREKRWIDLIEFRDVIRQTQQTGAN